MTSTRYGSTDVSRWQGVGGPPPRGGFGPLCSECGVSQWVELGGGPAEDINRPNIDVRTGPSIDFVCDLEREPLPLHDGHATYVKAIHFLQHISRDGARHMMREVYRILAPGGRFYVMVGDLEFICKRILEDGPYDGWLQCLFHDPSTVDSLGFHRWAYTTESLKGELESIGFVGFNDCGPYNAWERKYEVFKPDKL